MVVRDPGVEVRGGRGAAAAGGGGGGVVGWLAALLTVCGVTCFARGASDRLLVDAATLAH